MFKTLSTLHVSTLDGNDKPKREAAQKAKGEIRKVYVKPRPGAEQSNAAPVPVVSTPKVRAPKVNVNEEESSDDDAGDHYNSAIEEEEAVNMVDFDTENGEDPKDIYQTTNNIKVDFNRKNPRFFFIQLEMLLESAGCKSQWHKRLVLQRNLPSDVVEDIQDILSRAKTEAGVTAYFDAKFRILEIYAPRAEDKWKEAKEMVMTGRPSQLLKKLISHICPKHPKMEGCCAEDIISGIWREKLPPVVRARIADLSIGGGGLETICRVADACHASTQGVNAAVAAIDINGGGGDVAAIRGGASSKKKKTTGGNSPAATSGAKPKKRNLTLTDHPPAVAKCICNMAVVHFIVPNPIHVRGRTSPSPAHPKVTKRTITDMPRSTPVVRILIILRL